VQLAKVFNMSNIVRLVYELGLGWTEFQPQRKVLKSGLARALLLPVWAWITESPSKAYPKTAERLEVRKESTWLKSQIYVRMTSNK
jgi:hypothetical protein